jgi:rRNA processing protein Krr1/Pno1
MDLSCVTLLHDLQEPKRRQKCRRGTRADLTRILETMPEIQAELREQRRLLEILTARQTCDAAQQGEHGSRR